MATGIHYEKQLIDGEEISVLKLEHYFSPGDKVYYAGDVVEEYIIPEVADIYYRKDQQFCIWRHRFIDQAGNYNSYGGDKPIENLNCLEDHTRVNQIVYKGNPVDLGWEIFKTFEEAQAEIERRKNEND